MISVTTIQFPCTRAKEGGCVRQNTTVVGSYLLVRQ